MLALPAPAAQGPCARAWEKIAQNAEKHLGSPAPWKISAQAEAEIEEIWKRSGLIRRDRLRATADILLREREKAMNPVSAFFFRGAVRSSLEQNSLYDKTLGRLIGFVAGPHYNPVFNRIHNPFRAADEGIIETLVRMHELDHAADRNRLFPVWLLGMKATVAEYSNFIWFRTPFGAMFRHWVEAKAIGAQWETVRRIPREVRAQYMEEVARFKTEFLRRPIFLDEHEAFLLRHIVSKGRAQHFLDAMKPLPATLPNWMPRPPRFYLTEELSFDSKSVSRLTKPEQQLTKQQRRYARKFFAQAMKDFLEERKPLEEVQATWTREEMEKGHELQKYYNAVVGAPRSHPLRYPMADLAEASLKYADLPKDEFIRKLQEIHGYTFRKLVSSHVWGPTAYKKFLLGISSPLILFVLYDANYAKDGGGVPSYDLALAFRLYAGLFSDEPFWAPDFENDPAMRVILESPEWQSVEKLFESKAGQAFNQYLQKAGKQEAENYLQENPDLARGLIADFEKAELENIAYPLTTNAVAKLSRFKRSSKSFQERFIFYFGLWELREASRRK
jgi:hypothetical protein